MVARATGSRAAAPALVRHATAAAQEHAKALNAARHFEIDDVIDPADTRGLISATLAAAAGGHRAPRPRFVDTW